ncbi:hypothetical protein ANCCAN_05588 [Ancylostoma caninum]|uniref:Serpentine receptor class gamma n=1 Tax=Ancylostoma caninum TaxID=29170 RepID=A0A368GY67_ANCCA|nr:hypothetical protein ANCCAN_05588 [Ancylostoma caninum]
MTCEFQENHMSHAKQSLAVYKTDTSAMSLPGSIHNNDTIRDMFHIVFTQYTFAFILFTVYGTPTLILTVKVVLTILNPAHKSYFKTPFFVLFTHDCLLWKNSGCLTIVASACCSIFLVSSLSTLLRMRSIANSTGKRDDNIARAERSLTIVTFSIFICIITLAATNVRLEKSSSSPLMRFANQWGSHAIQPQYRYKLLRMSIFVVMIRITSQREEGHMQQQWIHLTALIIVYPLSVVIA